MCIRDRQWIVLDGAVDADWIESMNSVMDDNKLLTLANNERIVMSSSMRLIFEITHLQHATLATVSRAGILYIGEGELGWMPIKDRWLSTKVPEHLKTHIDILFDRFVPPFLDYVIGLPKTIVPMTPYAYVRSLCDLLESLLVHPSSPFAPVHDDVNAKVFLYCCIWTFGSCISYPLGVVDYRAQFSAFVRREFGEAVSYTHLRAHETPEHLVCRLLLEKKKQKHKQETTQSKAYNKMQNNE
eukprot:TRINITY_DN30815_c0_g1_i3.p1 TRINITY_DN30815_c0_g1~~TRINITY_DN30815_c0_g1_i3.p1  ORF type:complete len:242 (+),score=41.91 TRINITY_DN30815_c0_g1_i3:110-835(+)